MMNLVESLSPPSTIHSWSAASSTASISYVIEPSSRGWDADPSFHGSVHTATVAVCIVLVIFVVVLGTFGNGLVLLSAIQSRRRKLRSNFDVLIYNLAGADFLICSCLSPTYLYLLFSDPPSPTVFCGGFLFCCATCGLISLLTLVAIALHRHSRVRKVRGALTTTKTALILLAIYAVSLAGALGGTLHVTLGWTNGKVEEAVKGQSQESSLVSLNGEENSSENAERSFSREFYSYKDSTSEKSPMVDITSYEDSYNNCQITLNSEDILSNNVVVFFISPIVIFSFMAILISYVSIAKAVRLQTRLRTQSLLQPMSSNNDSSSLGKTGQSESQALSTPPSHFEYCEGNGDQMYNKPNKISNAINIELHHQSDMQLFPTTDIPTTKPILSSIKTPAKSEPSHSSIVYNTLKQTNCHGWTQLTPFSKEKLKQAGMSPAPSTTLKHCPCCSCAVALDRENKAVSMCFVVVIIITLCWLPLVASHLVELFTGQSIIIYQVKLCGIALVFLNSALDPYMYAQNSGGMKQRYGRIFWDMLRCECGPPVTSSKQKLPVILSPASVGGNKKRRNEDRQSTRNNVLKNNGAESMFFLQPSKNILVKKSLNTINKSTLASVEHEKRFECSENYHQQQHHHQKHRQKYEQKQHPQQLPQKQCLVERDQHPTQHQQHQSELVVNKNRKPTKHSTMAKSYSNNSLNFNHKKRTPLHALQSLDSSASQRQLRREQCDLNGERKQHQNSQTGVRMLVHTTCCLASSPDDQSLIGS